MFDNTLKALILISTLLYVPGLSPMVFDIGVFRLGVIALWVASSYQPIQRSYDFYGMIFLGIVLIFNCICHLFSVYETSHSINIFLMCLGIHLIIFYTKDPKSVYKFFSISIAVSLVVYFFQIMFFNPLPGLGNEDFPGGLMFTAPRLTTLICVVFPYLNFSLMMICLGSLFLVSDMQLTLIGVAFTYFFLKVKSIQIRTLLLIIALFGGLNFYDEILNSFAQRFKIWSDILQGFVDSPVKASLIGYGVSYPRGIKGIPINVDPTIISSHLQFIIGTGFVGLTFFLFIWGKFLKAYDGSKEGMAVMMVFLISFIEYPFEITRLWIVLMCVISFFIIQKIDEVKA